VDYKLYRLKKEIKIYWIGFTIQHYIYLNISIKEDVFLKMIDKHTNNSGVVFDKISKSGDGGHSGDIFHAKGSLLVQLLLH
jgi:hypothetical protein